MQRCDFLGVFWGGPSKQSGPNGGVIDPLTTGAGNVLDCLLACAEVHTYTAGVLSDARRQHSKSNGLGSPGITDSMIYVAIPYL